MANNASIANFGGDNIVYSSAGSASLIDIGADALLSGITATQLAGGQLRISFSSGGAATDRLSIDYKSTYAVGTVSLENGFSVPNQLYINTSGNGAYSVGTVAGGTAGTDLVISFNPTFATYIDPILAVQMILRNLTFSSTEAGSPVRAISVVLVDHDSAVSTPVVATVNQIVLPTAPSDITLSIGHLAENTSTVSAVSIGTLTSTDINGADSHSYTIVGGADAAVFEVDAISGVLSFKAGTVLDFEVKPSYAVTIRSTDTDALFFDKTVTVTLDDVNDAPLLAHNLGTTVIPGGTVVIGSAQLSLSDQDNVAADLTYTLQTLAAHGTLALSGTVLLASDSFTQADIDAGRLTYVSDGTAGADGFTFTAADGAGGTLSSASFAVTVATVAAGRPATTTPSGLVATTPVDGGVLIGTRYNDTLTGLDGRDTFHPGGGSDIIDGGGSIDTVVFTGSRADYQIGRTDSGGFSVTAGDGSMVSLDSVERLVFADQSFALDVTPASALAGRYYLAALGRNADDSGLTFYAGALDGEGHSLEIARSFLASAEFSERYGASSDTDFITQLYSNALGRIADTDGLNYYLGRLAEMPGLEGRALVLVDFVQSDEMQVKLAGIFDDGMPLFV